MVGGFNTTIDIFWVVCNTCGVFLWGVVFDPFFERNNLTGIYDSNVGQDAFRDEGSLRAAEVAVRGEVYSIADWGDSSRGYMSISIHIFKLYIKRPACV